MAGFKNVFKVVSVFIGLVIGAGFASGQELVKFFVKFGESGFLGILLAGMLLSFIALAVMDICYIRKISNYDEFLDLIFGKNIGLVVDFSVMLFIELLFCAMLAGTGALLKEAFGLSPSAGIILMAGMCLLTLMFDLRGIVNVSVVLAPVLVIGGVFFGLYSFFTESAHAFIAFHPLEMISKSFVWSAVIYSSYNLITSVSVLAGMGGLLTSRKVVRLSSAIGGLALTVLALCFSFPLFRHFSLLEFAEVPMYRIAQFHGSLVQLLYIVILLAAIFTTAVSNAFAAFGYVQRKLKLNPAAIKITGAVISVVIAHVGFSGIVNHVYSFFGYVGLFEIIAIVVFWLKLKAEPLILRKSVPKAKNPG